LHFGERYGVDVASHQGVINWQRVARDNITFAYIKATEGGDFADEAFSDNWTDATAAGLDRGAYHFFTLCTPGAEQARNFLRVAAPTEDALAPAVDLELAGNCGDRPPVDEVNTEVDAFLQRVEGAWAREVVLYVGNDWEAIYPTRARLERPLWVRRFLLRPDEQWFMWQLHGYARVDGIGGGADLNVMRAEHLSAAASSGGSMSDIGLVLIGALLGFGGSVLGSGLTARFELKRTARLDLFQDLAPELGEIDPMDPDKFPEANSLLLKMERTAIILSRNERADIEALKETLWDRRRAFKKSGGRDAYGNAHLPKEDDDLRIEFEAHRLNLINALRRKLTWFDFVERWRERRNEKREFQRLRDAYRKSGKE
jgi:lysozyme